MIKSIILVPINTKTNPYKASTVVVLVECFLLWSTLLSSLSSFVLLLWLFCLICVTSLNPYQIPIITAVEKGSIEDSFMIYGSLHNVKSVYIISVVWLLRVRYWTICDHEKDFNTDFCHMKKDQKIDRAKKMDIHDRNVHFHYFYFKVFSD